MRSRLSIFYLYVSSLILLSACVSNPVTLVVPSVTLKITTPSATIPPSSLTAAARAENIQAATATTGARQTIIARTRTPLPTRTPRTPTPTPSVTPTADYVFLADAWTSASVERSGIRFEYPLIYNYPPFSDIACAPSIVGNQDGYPQIEVGERIWIWIYRADGKTAADLAAEFIGDGTEVRNVNQSEFTLDGEPATRVEYRFGELNRYGDVTFVVHDNRPYDINFTAGVFCDMYDPTIRAPSEFEAYMHLLETLRFID